ncbi:hypothetical protein ACET6U_20255 [Aeromonas rivipollensis]
MKNNISNGSKVSREAGAIQVDAFGYSDTYEYRTPKGVYLWLTLEHIWMSGDFCKEEIVQARDYRKKLIAIQEKIIDHSAQLASLIREQDDIYHHSGFIRGQHQSALDMMVEAGSNNYLFTSYIADQLEKKLGHPPNPSFDNSLSLHFP